ncbi:GmrSD restriction endonuclease domain-containing protein [Flaviflexus equikiangi]|uniref:GmrSD restriction endonuclease domain-containing protein n=1 Tax=Flaviflexus equikiangi TaxID=2758573 RepID=UPI0015F5D897|nr:DUF262 domain-containing protein [Flaviflexus equikiangi]
MKGNVKDIYTVFDGTDKELIIPVYQRNYDWGEKQCERLFDDLVDVVKKDRPKHFFGAVVGKPETGFSWVVIDGQQRLTTTSLLMLALSNSLSRGIVEADDPELSAKIRRNYLEGSGSFISKESKIKLKPVKHDLEAYRALLADEEPVEKSSVTINYRYFMQRIAERELTGDELWDAIRRLEAMILDLEAHDDPQRIFESLNSTGKELKESDKIRNLVLMGMPSKEQDHLYEHFWNRMEHNVHFDTDSFVRLFLVSKTRKTPRLDTVYEAFKEYLELSDMPVSDLLDSMRSFSEYFRDLNSATTGIARADARLRRYNLLRHEVTMPALMPLLGDFRAGQISADDFADTIELVDAYLFRRLVVGVPSNALNKIFATLYSDARRLRTEGAKIADVIAYLLLRRADTSGRFPTDEEFREAFSTRSFFSFTANNRRYLFECLENTWSKDNRAIATALERGDLSIEHIMPQTLTKDWREELRPDPERVHQTWLHRIGNLTVTGYNSEYSNASFTAKKTVEAGFDSSPYRLNEYIKQTSTWTEADIRHRNEALTSVALSYWPMIDTEFEPVREPLPTLPMGDDISFTNRVIVSFEYDGTTTTVKSFKDLTRLVIRQLMAGNRESIYEYAAGGGLGFTLGKTGSNRYQEELAPELWVAVSNSTNEKMSILRALFNHLNFDTDDLVFTLRPYQDDELEPAAENPYGELLKFLPLIESLEGTQATESDIADLRTEFGRVFTDFELEGWREIKGRRGYEQLADAGSVESFSVEEALASIMMTKEIEDLTPGIFHQTIVEGSLARWLKRIEDLTASKRATGGRNIASMWEQLQQIVEEIPRGKWVSYGDLAKAVKSAPQPVGNYIASNRMKNAHRVLRTDGTISDGFSWLDENETRSPRDLLSQEGIVFDEAGRASAAQRWSIPEK